MSIFLAIFHVETGWTVASELSKDLLELTGAVLSQTINYLLMSAWLPSLAPF